MWCICVHTYGSEDGRGEGVESYSKQILTFTRKCYPTYGMHQTLFNALITAVGEYTTNKSVIFIGD